MGTITIGTHDYEIYGDAAGLEEYANGDPDYATYAAAVADDADQVNRVHVRATRLIAALPFTDASNAVPATAAAAVNTACYELVIAALLDPDVLTQDSTAQNVRSIAAEGVSTSYFAPLAGSRFPQRVMVHLGLLLGAATSSSGIEGGAFVAGTSCESAFDADDVYGVTSG